jgi:hypothetical protein
MGKVQVRGVSVVVATLLLVGLVVVVSSPAYGTVPGMNGRIASVVCSFTQEPAWRRTSIGNLRLCV